GSKLFAFTGAAAVVEGPCRDHDQVDIVFSDPPWQLDNCEGSERKVRAIRPYDVGVFMYLRNDPPIPRVSDIQAYLDLYALGGSNLKQADWLLTNAIEPRWRALSSSK